MISLLKAWKNEFSKTNQDVPISITSDDSGGGIASLINRTTDIALSSRDLTAQELLLAHLKGVHIKRSAIARDAIAFIVNPKNKIESIKIDQIEAIYKGQINNWKELGGNSLLIDRLKREKESGTYAYFQEHVMHGQDCCASTNLIPSMSQTLEKVSTDPSALAFVGLHDALGAKDKVKILGLKLIDQSEPIRPSAETITKYALSRPLLIFSEEYPKDSTKRFIAFCLSEDGQKIVHASGYIPVK
jgi:phosphate transport system substrate-binding protein